MRPAINIQAFGGSWLDSAKEMASKVADSASDLVGGAAGTAASAAGAGLTQGITGQLEQAGTRIATAAAREHASTLIAPAEPALGQLTTTLKWVGLGVGAVGVGALIFFIARGRRK
jgi:hypothetical protein